MLARVHHIERYTRHKLILLLARSAEEHIEPVDPLVLDREVHADIHVRPADTGLKRHIGLPDWNALAARILEDDFDRASSPRLVGFERDDHPKVAFFDQEGRHLLGRLYTGRCLSQTVNDPDDAHHPVLLYEHSLTDCRYGDVGTRIRHVASTLLREQRRRGRGTTMGQRYTTSVSFGSSQSPGRPVPPSTETPGKQAFEQFESLTRKLVGVPKAKTRSSR